jgi:hypothetical protein
MAAPQVKSSLRDLEGASWSALLLPPIAWFADQQVGYRLAVWACDGGSLLVVHLVNVVALAAALAGGAIALRDWWRLGGGSDEADRPAAHGRFLSLLALMLAAVFALPILAQLVATFILDPCQR